MILARSPGASLPRHERLRDPAAFRRLFHGGARLERSSFVLLWMPAPGCRAVAFAVSRRLGGSVVRNRARRRLREAYRRQKAVMPGTGVRLCLVARRPALRVSFAELVTEVGRALRQAAGRGAA